MKSIFGIAVLIAATAGIAQAQDKVVVTPVVKTNTTVSGQPIALPTATDNPEVAVSIYDIPPGMALAQHRHQFPRYGYVLSGQLRVTNLDTGVVTDVAAGGFIVEALGQWHYGENPGTEPLKLLVIDQAPTGVANIEPKK